MDKLLTVALHVKYIVVDKAAWISKRLNVLTDKRHLSKEQIINKQLKYQFILCWSIEF